MAEPAHGGPGGPGRGHDEVGAPAAAAGDAVSFESSAGRWILAVAVLGSGMAFLDGTVVNVALPDIGRGLNASTSALQWVLNAYLLTLASLILLGGSLGDRYGRRLVFVLGAGLFTLASLLCALAPSAQLLIAARLVQGVGGALLVAREPRDDRVELSRRRSARARSARGLDCPASPRPSARCLAATWSSAVSWRAVFVINLPLVSVVMHCHAPCA